MRSGARFAQPPYAGVAHRTDRQRPLALRIRAGSISTGNGRESLTGSSDATTLIVRETV